MKINKIILLCIFLLAILTLSSVNATEDLLQYNLTDNGEEPIEISANEKNNETSSDLIQPISTKIESSDVNTYYKEKSELIGYLKDDNNNPISNRNISISLNGKTYTKLTDKSGKFLLNLNLKPNTYKTTITFNGYGNYTASSINTLIKVNEAPLVIETKNYKTYYHSDLFFKAKVLNKITKNPVAGIKVAFKVNIGNGKYKTYYATTDKHGMASLKKNLKVGLYKVCSSIKKSKYVKSSNKAKSTLTIKPTAEMGCASIYIQVSNYEGVTGFRRDSTYAADLYIKVSKWYGRTAIKQYKTTNSYFFHSITTSDGWMIGTGGIDNSRINRAIEDLAGKMVKSGKIQKSYLRKIQEYERYLGIGHFAIKAPNGNYATVWASSISTGKLKAGEYISVPNGKYCYRHGTYAHFNKNPAKAGIKIAATDSYGVNRRDITVFHWKATTSEGKTTSKVNVYAANDDGHLVGMSTGYLKDNIHFKNKFFSKDKLPKAPSSKLIGKQNFGSIDKLIKTQTVVSAPKLTKTLNQTKYFKVTVKSKSTKKAVKYLKLKIKVDSKTYSIKTDKNGVAKFDAKSLKVGLHNVLIYSDNIKYFVNKKSSIEIKE